MVELFEEDGVRGAKRYLEHLKMEYAFWMDGAESLLLNQAYRSAVRMPDGSLLNRYWDDRDTPRDESWIEDVETARHSGRPPNEVYRDLRAGAASGWDYSSRWLRDPARLASIRTTQFIPIDLNAFLFKLESAIANISASKGDKETADLFRQKASDRRAAVNRYLWDEENGCYRDYDWRREARRCSLRPALCRCMWAWRRMSRLNGCPMPLKPVCSRRAVFSPPNMKPGSSGISRTAGRRSSGWRSRGSSSTATTRWEMRSPGAGCTR